MEKMRKQFPIYQILLFLAFFVFSYLPVNAEDSIPKAVKTAAENVVQVVCKTDVGEEMGAGFAVSKQVREEEEKEKKMYIVTSYHLVEANKKHIEVKWKEQTVDAKAVGYFPTQDVAILELSKDFDDIKLLPIRKEKQKNETSIYLVGYQFDEEEIKDVRGKIISQKEMVVTEGRDAISVYETDAKLDKKNLGGPALDKTGYVVGVNFYNGNSGAIITEKELIYFLEEKGIQYKTVQINWILVGILAIVFGCFTLIFIFIKSKNKNKNQLKPYIVGVQGEFGGFQFPIEPGETIWFGRNSGECQIVFPKNKKISRRHCSISYDFGQQYFILTDLNSSNGTWIENERIEPSQPAVLQSGDEFYIGDSSNVFRVELI
ncbi:MAG: FHA domain-containing protein [Lachnospiraceae bacterium]